MKSHSQILQATIIFALIMSGCSTVSSPMPKTPQEVAQPIIESSPFATLSLLPTSNPTDTLVVQKTFTPKATQTPPPPSPTQFLLKTKFPKACQDEYYEDYTKISPDGSWLAESCFSNGTMQVSNQDGTKMFVVNSKDYFSDPYFPELTGSVTPAHWTNDSHFIYFTVTPEQWNDGAYLSLDSFAPLLCRMDIEKGEITQILWGTFYHSFSPTDHLLIEVQEFEHPVKLIVHDLKTGLSQTLIPDNNPKYGQAVRVVWSPDGSKFVFVAAFGGEFGDEVNEPNVQSLILVDLGALSQEVIISEIPDFIEPISWDEKNIITYTIMNYSDRYKITTYTYDYQNQEINVLPANFP